MCGIAGIAGQLDNIDPASFVSKSISLLNHRGPDDFGIMSWGEQDNSPRLGRDVGMVSKRDKVLFIHRRLSSLDLNPTGWQPMSLPDGSVVVTYNGEIYNYIELRNELENKGHIFISRSDTEVLLHAYQEWGISMLSHLEGMFAFCLFDVGRERLYLARDHFGIKPLFYTLKNGVLGFASEPSVLLEIPGISRRANLHAVCNYARFGATDHDENTLWQDIHRVLPAHYLRFELKKPMDFETAQYWRIDLKRQADVSFSKAANTVRELFLDSVRLHMRSDVPYGATLSGGIDSSSVVMAMRQNLGPNVSFPVFSYISEERSTSEELWIDEVARAGNIKLTKIYPTSFDLRTSIDDLVLAQNEPFGSTSIFAQYKIFEAVKNSHLKVMLDGQGADEILGGYRSYIGARIASLIREGQFYDALELLFNSGSLPNTSFKESLLYTLNYLAEKNTKRSLAYLINKEAMPNWFDLGWMKSRGISLSHQDFTSERTVLKQALYQGLTHMGLPHLLRYADRNSMRFSIESRVPFLNVRLVEYLFSLPETYLIDQKGVSKAVFRQAMRGLVPDKILDRKDKIGFATPENHWLRQSHEWASTLLSKKNLAEHLPFLNQKQVDAEWTLFVKTGNNFPWRFWRWINLVKWAQAYQISFS